MARPSLTSEEKEALERMGHNLARVRKEKGLTQEELAEMVGLHPRVVQKIEYGQTNLRTTTTARILKALHITWEILMSGRPSAPEGTKFVLQAIRGQKRAAKEENETIGRVSKQLEPKPKS